MVIEEDTNRVLWIFGRTEEPVTGVSGTTNTTRIGVDIIDIDYFEDLCEQFLYANPHENKNIGLRDTVGPWVMRAGSLAIHAYDTQSEQVDIGTPEIFIIGKLTGAQQIVDNKPIFKIS